jgi:nucleoside-diphosphate-sugar epimerase
MRLALLGATSQIAKDFVRNIEQETNWTLGLFSRRPNAVEQWLKRSPLAPPSFVGDFAEFARTKQPYDVILNFVGSGNPARTERVGATIMDVTHDFDELALQYLRRNPDCRYIFFSSGAVYGGGYKSPVDDQTASLIPINQLGAQDWYGISKIYAEARHRALSDLSIVDLRVFNYFSYSADIEARFLVTDVLRAIRDRQVLQTSHENIVRDYVGPHEISQLIQRVLSAPPTNVAIDCYTKSPVDKLSMLKRMQSEFDLKFELVERQTGLLATGAKWNYYSTSKKAEKLFGYAPKDDSMDVILKQSRLILR